MHDPRCDRLAHLLVNFSTRLQPGEKVLIDAFDIPQEMTVALIRAVREAGALPFVQIHQARQSPDNQEIVIEGIVIEGIVIVCREYYEGQMHWYAQGMKRMHCVPGLPHPEVEFHCLH